MKRQQFVTVCLMIQLACIAVVLLHVHAVFQWIGNSHWLWKHRFPWGPSILAGASVVSVGLGLALCVPCIKLGTTRYRIVSSVAGVFFVGVILLLGIQMSN